MLLFVCGIRLSRWCDAICLSERSGLRVRSGVVVNEHLAEGLYIVAATLLLGEITDRNLRQIDLNSICQKSRVRLGRGCTNKSKKQHCRTDDDQGSFHCVLQGSRKGDEQRQRRGLVPKQQ